MDFGEKLRLVRTDRNITQEGLAELLSVSRQAVSKWESGMAYPETEKLILLSKELGVSLDYLLLNEETGTDKNEKKTNEIRPIVISNSGKIMILNHDKSQTILCQSVNYSKILSPAEQEPPYILSGVDKITFWGPHSNILGWYETEEDVKKEMDCICKAIAEGKLSYELQYCARVQFVGLLGRTRRIEE